MQNISIIFIVSFGTIILLLWSLIHIHFIFHKFKKKYGQILNVDAERTKILSEIDSLKQQTIILNQDFNNRKEKLTSEYNNGHLAYEMLKKEISLLEESLEMVEFGVYKPHFDFDTSEEYKQAIEKIYENEKYIIKTDRAVICNTEWTVSGSKVEGKRMVRQHQKLMLRAFNGECDAALSRVRWDNVLKMEERINRAFKIINDAGESNKSRITLEYLKLKLKELHLAYEYQEKLKEEKDEQRHIQEQMREEEKANREIEKAKEEAEKEETYFQKALEKARIEAAKTSGDQLIELNNKINELEEKLKSVQEKERAISRAQLTKSGHVYIISNIGSFGENVFKIGMTRRLEPLDRIKELGDASVPFPFDIHALLPSENAPEIELKLHNYFSDRQTNLINSRKEFFNITIEDLLSWAKSEKIDIKITKLAEAREYRETKAMQIKDKNITKIITIEKIPTSIENIFSKD